VQVTCEIKRNGLSLCLSLRSATAMKCANKVIGPWIAPYQKQDVYVEMQISFKLCILVSQACFVGWKEGSWWGEENACRHPSIHGARSIGLIRAAARELGEPVRTLPWRPGQGGHCGGAEVGSCSRPATSSLERC
jgi:hypothetical protein